MSKVAHESCYQWGRKISDGLRLIMDGGLGWQQRTVGPTVLTSPTVELLRIFSRLGERAAAFVINRGEGDGDFWRQGFRPRTVFCCRRPSEIEATEKRIGEDG